MMDKLERIVMKILLYIAMFLALSMGIAGIILVVKLFKEILS